MKNTRLTALFLLILMLLAIFALTGSAEGETPAESAGTTALATGTDDASDTGEAENSGGFFNTFLSLRENGGLVTRSFGERSTIEYENGTKGVAWTIPWPQYILTIVLVCLVSYFLGSVNFGVLISKKMYKDDVRNYGSGNAGMTNVLRVYGKKAALLTFLGDVVKSMVCAILGMVLAGNGCGYLAVAFCMIGHAFPIFYHFKGGKAVASAFGGLFALEPVATLLLLLCFIIIVAFTKYVSLASIFSATLIPVFINAFWRAGWFGHFLGAIDSPVVMITSVFFACFIIWRHRSNIKRLLAGEERKTNFFAKKKEQGDAPSSGKNG